MYKKLFLSVYGDEAIECTRVVKKRGLLAYNGDAIVYQAEIVNDFSGYSLTDEQGVPVAFETASEQPSDADIIMAAMAEIYEKQLTQDEEILTTQLAIAEMYEARGGEING